MVPFTSPRPAHLEGGGNMTVQTLIDVLTRIDAADVVVHSEDADGGCLPIIGVRVAYNADGEPSVTIL